MQQKQPNIAENRMVVERERERERFLLNTKIFSIQAMADYSSAMAVPLAAATASLPFAVAGVQSAAAPHQFMTAGVQPVTAPLPSAAAALAAMVAGVQSGMAWVQSVAAETQFHPFPI